MQRGKELEHRFSRSLKKFVEGNGGVYWRIEDGGAVSRSPQYGDFFYESPNGYSFVFECKETEEKRFRLRNLRQGQVERLTEFALLDRCYSYVVILFKNPNRAFIVDIFRLLQWEDEHPLAKSVKIDEFEKIGISPIFDKKEKIYEISPLFAL